MEDNENDPPRDPRLMSWATFPEQDFEGHHAMSVYVGFHVPAICRRKIHRKHHHHHHHHTPQKSKDYEVDINRPEGTPPAERVRFILDKEDDDAKNEPHPVFSEMEEFHQDGDEMEWRETARWVKFEEDVEEGGNRWSKPHIATVSLHSLLVLRSCLLNGVVLLDIEATDLSEITDILLTNIVSNVQLSNEQQQKIKEILLSKHRHQRERHNDWMDKSSRLPLIKSLAEVGKNSNGTPSPDKQNGSKSEDIPPNSSTGSLSENSQPQCQNSDREASSADFFHWFGKTFNSLPALERHQLRQGFMRKIPPDAQASNILVGELDFLEKTVTAFVRLSQASTLGDLTEVPIPTKFLFVVLGPPSSYGTYHEVGRAFAAVMSDEVFHDVAYKARTRQDLLAGLDEFMDAATVLPASAWDPSMRIEPLQQIVTQENRRKQEPKDTGSSTDRGSDDGLQEIGLKRTGKLFGGLVSDIRNKAPWYKSDFKDFFALQCIASVVFLYFACLAPIITFGGLLGHATKQRMAAMENLLASAVCGVVYSLFSGQPLTVLGTTGALLVFEGTIFNYCEWWNVEYLPFRLWIGLWITVILFLLVALDASVLVCYITRFTEEVFATLISVIFIFKAFENVMSIRLDFPMKSRSHSVVVLCLCHQQPTGDGASNHNQTFWSREECLKQNGTFVSDVCTYSEPHYVPNVFLLSLILFFGTFAITILLRKLKFSPFFIAKIRHGLSDFAVIFAMISMTALDWLLGLGTPKLDVPQDFKPTWSERSWVIPFFGNNAIWTAAVAVIPALVATVLIFMDQQITAVIVNRKDNKLKKGSGYHLDLFVLAILIAICSIFGLPWVVAATMLSMTHVASLKTVPFCLAPGEKPRVQGVREQRGTHLFISVLLALSMFFTPLLKHIPMPVLYGIFLYMGVVSFKGLQFLDRILILFMPQKYQPDYIFLRHVPVRVVHSYTAIQLTCLVVLFAIKFFPESALFFPAVLVIVILIRKHLLVHVFDELHLKILDDSMPEAAKTLDDYSRDGSLQNFSSAYHYCDKPEAVSSGSLVKQKADKCILNISELLTQSSVWKCIDQQSQKTPPFQRKETSQLSLKKKKKRSPKKELSSPTETQSLPPLPLESSENFAQFSPSSDDNPSSEAHTGSVDVSTTEQSRL